MIRLHPPLHRLGSVLARPVTLGLDSSSIASATVRLHHNTLVLLVEAFLRLIEMFLRLVEMFLRLLEMFLRLLEMFLRLSNTANSAKVIESGLQNGLPVGCDSTPGI